MMFWEVLLQGHDAWESVLALEMTLWEVLQQGHDAWESVLAKEMAMGISLEAQLLEHGTEEELLWEDELMGYSFSQP